MGSLDEKEKVVVVYYVLCNAGDDNKYICFIREVRGNVEDESPFTLRFLRVIMSAVDMWRDVFFVKER